MEKFLIEPLLGIGLVKFGMSREEVAYTVPKIYRTFRIFYDEANKVEYIELAGYKSEDFMAIYNGINIFETKADAIIEEISKKVPYDKTCPEISYTYIFPDLELSFWMAIIPSKDDDKDSDDYNDSLYFQTVGIGIRGYYSNRK